MFYYVYALHLCIILHNGTAATYVIMIAPYSKEDIYQLEYFILQNIVRKIRETAQEFKFNVIVVDSNTKCGNLKSESLRIDLVSAYITILRCYCSKKSSLFPGLLTVCYSATHINVLFSSSSIRFIGSYLGV